MNDDGRVRVDCEDHLAVVTIDRPAKANALTAPMVTQFNELVVELDRDPDVRAIVITGAGERAFCAGGDLDSLLPAAMDAASDVLNPDPTRRFLSSVFTPVVAAVRGACLGGGFALLLGTDVRIVSDDARFGLPEVQFGLLAGGGTHVRLPQQIPWPVAMELLLTGEPLDARRAFEVGLVNRVVAGADVLPTAMSVASRIAANGPLATRISKEIAVRALAQEGAFALEHALNGRVLGSADAREGVRAAKEKKAPHFRGR